MANGNILTGAAAGFQAGQAQQERARSFGLQQQQIQAAQMQQQLENELANQELLAEQAKLKQKEEDDEFNRLSSLSEKAISTGNEPLFFKINKKQNELSDGEIPIVDNIADAKMVQSVLSESLKQINDPKSTVDKSVLLQNLRSLKSILPPPTQTRVGEELGGFAEDVQAGITGERKLATTLASEERGVQRDIAGEIRTKEGEVPSPSDLIVGAAQQQFPDDPLKQAEEVARLKKLGAKAATTTVNLGALGKTTINSLEKDIIALETAELGLKIVEDFFEPEFLEFLGKGKAAAQRFANKLGLSTSTEFLERRAKWFAQAKEGFLAYRKWITGVAGGEKEFQEIAKAVPDPERDAPAEFIAKLEQLQEWKETVKTWKLVTREQGLSLSDTRQQLFGEQIQRRQQVGEQETIESLDVKIKKLEDKQRGR